MQKVRISSTPGVFESYLCTYMARDFVAKKRQRVHALKLKMSIGKWRKYFGDHNADERGYFYA